MGPGRCWCSVCCQIPAKNDQDSFIASPRVPQYGLRCSGLSITRHVPTDSRSFLSALGSADRQAAPTSLWTWGGNDPSARLIHRLSRTAREVGLLRSDEQMPGTVTRGPGARLRRGLGVGVRAWSGRRAPLPRLIEAERAIDHEESRTSATLTRPQRAERARANPALEQRKSDVPGASRSREFCNLPGRNATPEGPGR
jgi:hypothetical protein